MERGVGWVPPGIGMHPALPLAEELLMAFAAVLRRLKVGGLDGLSPFCREPRREEGILRIGQLAERRLGCHEGSHQPQAEHGYGCNTVALRHFVPSRPSGDCRKQ
jgi:hypothetical protein